MIYLKTIFIWFKVGWPSAKALIDIISDGKITREEVYLAVDKVIDEDGITLWEK